MHFNHKPQRLTGKVAIVTGAGSSGQGIGTGKAISILLAREGAKVLLVDNILKNAEETNNNMRADGGCSSAYAADVTQSEMCKKMIEAALERYGKVDILVNNVGIIGRGSVVDVRQEDWDKTMVTNLTGTRL